MRMRGVDRLCVVYDGQIVGMVTSTDVVRLEEILEALAQQDDETSGR